MKTLTWQKPGQQNVAQELIKIIINYVAELRFYNFQKGSFSAICLLKDGGLTTFFGNYSLKGAEISIILLPESVNDKNYDTYFGWPEGKCTFKVEDLSYSSLRLEYGGTKSIFRKF